MPDSQTPAVEVVGSRSPALLRGSSHSSAAYGALTPSAPSPGHLVPLAPSPPPASWVQPAVPAAPQEDGNGYQGMQSPPAHGLGPPSFLGGDALSRVDEVNGSIDSPSQSFPAQRADSYDYDAAAKAAEEAVAAAEHMLSQNDGAPWGPPSRMMSGMYSDGPQRMGSNASVYRMPSCASGNGVFRRDSMNSNGVYRLQSAASGPMRLASQASGGHRLSSSPHSFDSRRECQVAVTGNFR